MKQENKEIDDYNVNKNVKNSIILIFLIIISIFIASNLSGKKEVYENTFAIVVNKGSNYLLNDGHENLVWESSDESIAIVNSDGVVTGISSGEVVITASTDDKKYYEYKIVVKNDNKETVTNIHNENLNNNDKKEENNNVKEEVNVGNQSDEKEQNKDKENDKKEEKIEVKKIVFGENNKTIYVGDKYQTSITITPNEYKGSIKYTSSNNNVATISNDGLVVGKNEGTVTIKAISDNGVTGTMKIVVKKKIISKTLTVNFDSNGSDSISSTKLQCETEGSSCTIKFPSINRSGYNILGWSKNSKSNMAEYRVGEDVNINGNTTYYAITSKDIVATFNGNGANTNESNKKCTIYNKEDSCSITAPSITRSGYNIIGWGNSETSKNKVIDVGSTITLKNNVTYYAITSKELTASFDGNGANISYNTKKCTIYNKEGSCSVTAPSITRNNYTALGWGTDSSTSKVVASASGNINISSNSKYYAITKIGKDGIEKGCTGWMAVNGYYYANTNGSSRGNISAGTAFTIEGVEGNFFRVSIPNIAGEKYIEHKYVMINLSDYIPSMHFEISNASSSIYKSSGYNLEGVTGNRLYATGKVYNVRLRKEEYMAPVLYTVAKKLLTAQNSLLSQGYSIKVYDVYRPYHVSREIYTSLTNLYNSNSVVRNNILYSYGASGARYSWGTGWFLASGVSAHNTGSAIDMSLVYTNSGKEVAMPTAMHELSTKAIKYYSPNVSSVPANYSKEMNDGAKILDRAGTNAGLSTLASEWWHFQDSSAHSLIKSYQNSGCNFEVTTIYSY